MQRILGFAEAKNWILVDLSEKQRNFSATGTGIQATNLWMLIKVIKVTHLEISLIFHMIYIQLNET